MIYEIRGKQVMLDSDVSKLFGYETKYINRQVQRNINRFPENYCFQLTEEEYYFLRCQNGTLKLGKGQHKKYLPYVFTEYGITMLAGILKSEIAVAASLKIVNTFIAMRYFISSNLVNNNNGFHDRFIIIDKKELYHCGASFKDLGKKCFGISRIEDDEILEKIKESL